MENTIANMTYNKYLKIMKKSDSVSLKKCFVDLMSDLDNTQNWDLLNLKLNIFQQRNVSL
jgi:hypothetical protein